MTRRAIVLGLTSSFLLTKPLVERLVLAQAPRSVPKLVILGPQDAQALAVQVLRHGLRELGYIEGQTLLIEERYAEDKLERLPALAAELVRLKPDVIFTMSTPGVLAAKRATHDIPIVAIASLVEGARVVQNLARPEGNVTGLNLIELGPKRLQLLKEAAPKTTRVAILVNSANPAWDRYAETLDEAGRTLGLQLSRVEVRGPGDLEGAFAAMARSAANALLVVNDSVFSASGQRSWGSLMDNIATWVLTSILPGW